VALEQGRIWPEFHRELGGHDSFLQLDLAYGVASRTTLLASVPVLADRSYAIAHAGIQQDYGTTGFGDALVGVRQVIAGGLVGGLSVKLPSARHRIGGDFDGSILDPTLQPGSGSWDFVSTLQYAGHIAPWLMDWSLSGSYQINTKNDLGYRFGNLALAFVGFGIARDFDYGFAKRLMLAAPHRSGILLGYGLAVEASADHAPGVAPALDGDLGHPRQATVGGAPDGGDVADREHLGVPGDAEIRFGRNAAAPLELDAK
jgi:hypothetical protein